MSKLGFDPDFNTPHTEKAVARVIGHIEQATHSQAVAATLAANFAWIATFAGILGEVYAVTAATAGAGESMVYDVLKNGVSILTSTLTVNTASGSKKQIPLAIDPTKRSFVAGDVFTVARTYTAGTATPIGANAVVLEPTVQAY